MKNILLLMCSMLLLGSGCSLRKSAASQTQSASEDHSVEETKTSQVDTVITFDGSSMTAQIATNELISHPDKTFHFKTPQGEIKLTFKDSMLIAESIWNAQQKEVHLPVTTTKKVDNKKASTSQSNSEEKKSGGNTFWLYIIIAALLIIIYLLFRYK